MKVQIILTIISTLVETLFYGGTLNGWSSLHPVLIKEDYFAENCRNNSTIQVSCKSQSNSLSLVYTIASALSHLLNFLPGFLMDRYGIWFTRSLMLSMIGLGFLLAAIIDPLVSSFLLYFAFSLVSVGGVGIVVTNFGIGNLCTEYRGTVLNLISGSTDTSAIVFLIFRALYNIDIKLNYIFYFFAGFSIVFHFRTFLLMPKKIVPSVLPADYKYGYKQLGCFLSNESIENTSQIEDSGGMTAELTSKSSLKCSLKKGYFWSNVFHSCLVMLVLMFYIGNFNSWIENKVNDKDQISLYTNIFGGQLCAGLLFSSLSGGLIDLFIKFYEKSVAVNVAITKAIATVFLFCDFFLILALALSLIPIIKLQWLTFFLIMLTRALFFGTQAAFINMLLPAEHFGRLYSITIGTTGIFLFLQYPIKILQTNIIENNFVLVYGCFIFLIILATIHPFYLMKIVRTERGKTTTSNNLNSYESTNASSSI